MNETTKSKKIWGGLEWSIVKGEGIDIGCGPDPVTPNAARFDLEDGDANKITNTIKRQFDFVYASHCLEHMHDPESALAEWWQLVKVGGHLFFMVPDEDLYEQGNFPSLFNSDHKATYTISKQKSWSPRSFNVLQLALSLPHSRLVKLELQDHGYDRRLMKHGPGTKNKLLRLVLKEYQRMRRKRGISIGFLDRRLERNLVIDQTLGPDVLAQIACIVQKTG